MDARRFLTLCAAALGGAPATSSAAASMAPIPNPPSASSGRAAGRGLELETPTGRAAIAAANLRALQSSSAADFKGGVQVFAYRPGHIYEVWTAPLRVTTLALAPGENIIAMAAGDTVRWQIGQTTSGAGETERAHVMIKPMERGLETNLVLTTSARVYLLQLKSGAPDTFNAALTWEPGEAPSPRTPLPSTSAPNTSAPNTSERSAAGSGTVQPTGRLHMRFDIEAGRRPPPWTPTMVTSDGVRTFLRFAPSLASQEAPALFAVGADGERQLVNYRQQGELWLVDRVLDRAELRLGEGRSQVVKIMRRADRS